MHCERKEHLIMQNSGDIRKNIIEHLLWDSRIESADINVEVDEDHRVTLTGTAPSYMVKQAAGEDALRVSGVGMIYNQVAVEAPVGKGPQRSGEALEKAITSVLSLYPDFDEDSIEVSVSGNMVTLTGSADSYWKKLRAEEIAFEVGGVRRVINELSVVPTHTPLDREIARSIQNAIARTADIDLSKIGIEVDGGRVTLSGSVDSWATYSAAHTAAKYARGVVDLTNELTIRSGT
ncbi:MAG: BON domain-containing protein [Chitinivibrionales bacterium]|nr:BON domain-containing protein [Chitinivibrionales bacterium]